MQPVTCGVALRGFAGLFCLTVISTDIFGDLPAHASKSLWIAMLPSPPSLLACWSLCKYSVRQVISNDIFQSDGASQWPLLGGWFPLLGLPFTF